MPKFWAANSIRRWKLNLVETPNRVEECHSVIDASYAATAADGNFNASTLFIFRPETSARHIFRLDGTENVAILKDMTCNAVSSATALNTSPLSDPALVNITGTNERFAVIGGTAVMHFSFPGSSAILRVKRMNTEDWNRTAAGLRSQMIGDAQSVREYTLSGNFRLAFRAPINNRLYYGALTLTPSAICTPAVTDPLGTWAMCFSVLSTTTNVSAPLIRIHSVVRIQRELSNANNYLRDQHREVDTDLVATSLTVHNAAPVVVSTTPSLVDIALHDANQPPKPVPTTNLRGSLGPTPDDPPRRKKRDEQMKNIKEHVQNLKPFAQGIVDSIKQMQRQRGQIPGLPPVRVPKALMPAGGELRRRLSKKSSKLTAS